MMLIKILYRQVEQKSTFFLAAVIKIFDFAPLWTTDILTGQLIVCVFRANGLYMIELCVHITKISSLRFTRLLIKCLGIYVEINIIDRIQVVLRDGNFSNHKKSS